MGYCEQSAEKGLKARHSRTRNVAALFKEGAKESTKTLLLKSKQKVRSSQKKKKKQQYTTT